MRQKCCWNKEHPVVSALILFLAAGLTTLALSSVHSLTADIIENQARVSADEARHEVFQDAAVYDEYPASSWPSVHPRIDSVHLALSEAKEYLGFVIVSKARGYGGDVTVMTGISLDGSIRGIRVISDNETPGLGKKISSSVFTSRFLSRTADLPFSISVIRPNQNYVDALSGATISSRAMTEAVNTALTFSQALRTRMPPQEGS